jgi:hypothetical protein
VFYWDSVPAPLRPFYDRGYLREGWLRSALPGQAIARATLIAQRLALINAEVVFAEGPGVNVEDVLAAISMGFVSPALAAESAGVAELVSHAVPAGFSLPAFSELVALGAYVSDAMAEVAKGQAPSEARDMLGRPMAQTVAGQRALERAAVAEARAARLLPLDEWPRHLKKRADAFSILKSPAAVSFSALLSFLRDVGVGNAAAVAVASGQKPRLKDLSPVVAGEGTPGVWGSGDQMRIANEFATKVADLDGFPTREGRAYAVRNYAQNSAPANLFIQQFLYGGDQALRIARTRAVYIDTAQTQLLPLDWGNPGSGWMLLASREDPGPWKDASS